MEILKRKKGNGISLREWKDYAKSYCMDFNMAENTRISRRHTLDKVISYMEEEGITFIDIKAMLGFRSSLKEYAPNTVARYMRQISTFCNWMIGIGALEETLVPRKLKSRERYDEAKPILRKEDIQRLIGARRPDGMWRSTWTRNKALCFLAISSGMRKSEIMDMRPVDINYEALSITIPSGKGRKGRVVSITRIAVDALKEYADTVRPKEASQEDPFFCRVEDGKVEPMARSTVGRAIKDHIVETTGREDISPHCIRHTYASILAAENVPILDIKALLGHSSLAQTDRYLQSLGTPTDAAKHATAAIEDVITPRGWATHKDEPPLFR